MGWIADRLLGVHNLFGAGVPVAERRAVNFIGATVEDDEAEERTNITIDLASIGAAPETRQFIAGAGLTGGGDLTADRTLNVAAHADGSIAVSADAVQVGVLASDTQHGARGGGTQHNAATTSVAGFMPAADKTKLDGSTNFVAADAMCQRDGSGGCNFAYVNAGASGWADAGSFRAPNATVALAVRDGAGTGNLTAVATDSSNGVWFGQTSAQLGATYVRAPAASTLWFYNGTNAVGLWNASSVRSFVPLAVGSAPAAAGAVRLDNGAEVVFAGAAGDVTAIESVAASNDLVVGRSSDTIAVLATAEVQFEVGEESILYLTPTAVGVGGTPSDGGGEGVLCLKNTAGIPGSSPTNGCVIYAQAGAAKVKGSSGTVTTFGPAEPHCPVCGRDFAVEFSHPDKGEHVAVCLPCMKGALEHAGVNTSFFFISQLNT